MAAGLESIDFSEGFPFAVELNGADAPTTQEIGISIVENRRWYLVFFNKKPKLGKLWRAFNLYREFFNIGYNAGLEKGLKGTKPEDYILYEVEALKEMDESCRNRIFGDNATGCWFAAGYKAGYYHTNNDVRVRHFLDLSSLGEAFSTGAAFGDDYN